MIKQAIRPTITGNFKLSILGSIIASAFTPEELFKNGEQGVWYDPTDLATMYQEHTGGSPVTANGQPVGLMLDKSGNALNALQPISTQRPTYNTDPSRLTLDLVDDSLAFTVPTGGIDGYMVVGTDDGTASYGVSLPAGDYDIGGDYFMGGSVNGFLLREGDVSDSDLKKVEAEFVKNGAKASYGDVTNFSNFWRGKNLTEFPLIDTSSGTNFQDAWRDNNLTSFPLLDVSSGTNFGYAWYGNNLTSFPANMFDSCLATNFANAFSNTNLSEQSIDNILVSINSNRTRNGTFDQSGGSAPSVAGNVAIVGLRLCGWTVTVTGGF